MHILRKSMNRYSGMRISPGRMLCVLILFPLFSVSYSAACWLRYEGTVEAFQFAQILPTLGWIAFIKLFVFGWFRVYEEWRRPATFDDLVTLAKAATFSSLALILSKYLVFPGWAVPRSVLLIDWGLTIVIVGGLRSVVRLIEERRFVGFLSNQSIPVLIVGTNESGETLLRVIRRDSSLTYHVVGFITEEASIMKSSLCGIPVLGTLDETCTIAKKLDVTDILLTANELTGQNVRKLVGQARDCNVNVKVLPTYEQLLRDNIDLRPRTVSIEDLLRREPVKMDLAELHRWLDDQVLLVTGSAGSIGSEICRQLLRFKPKCLVAVDRSETGQFYLEKQLNELGQDIDVKVMIADVNDAKRMESIFAHDNPDIVFHAAAYKHVPLMETNPGEAIKNIVLATRTLADLAEKHRVGSFVQISTDKAVNPTSVMGVCKRIGELYVQSLAAGSVCRFVTVRFGNVLDSAGSVVPVFREQIASGGPVTVTHPDMRRFFMTIPEASQLVVQAGAMGKGGEIFVLDMGDPVKILDLAHDMIRLSGLEVDKDIEVKICGSRPGEKLIEELHVAGEQHIHTSHSKIMVAESSNCELKSIGSLIYQLAQNCEGTTGDILRLLKQIVPHFQPENVVPSHIEKIPNRSVDAGEPSDIVSVRLPETRVRRLVRNRNDVLTRTDHFPPPIANPKNFALIGATDPMVLKHVLAIQDTGNYLIAAVDSRDDARRMDDVFSQARCFTDVERFDRYLEKLSRGPDKDKVHYVSFCSPRHRYDANVARTLRSRAHAICDNPLMISPWNLDPLEDLEAEAGCRVYIVPHLRLIPRLVALKASQELQAGRERAEVCLTYVTGRGNWDNAPWKGSSEDFGDVATNIGMHSFDLLLWLFGEVRQCTVQVNTPQRMAGVLELKRARVAWFFSTNGDDLPKHVSQANKHVYRALTYDGQQIDFSDDFTDSHTCAYEEILAGRGTGIGEARPAIGLVHRIAHSDLASFSGPVHPLVSQHPNAQLTSKKPLASVKAA